MKKIFLILLFLIISNYAYANDKILKSGFITKSASVEEGMDVKDPTNKIIIIYNHGQTNNDKAIKTNLVLGTRISPTPVGEGKTTMSIGLSEGLN